MKGVITSVVQKMRIAKKSFIAIIGNKDYVGGVQFAYIGGIVAYLLAEIDLGTGGGHFESIDCALKLEAAPILSWRPRSYVSRI
jgi:hypothetical protein